MTTIDYEVITAAGAVAYTSNSLDIARDWLAERRLSLPGARVEEVITHVTRRRVYQPRAMLRAA